MVCLILYLDCHLFGAVTVFLWRICAVTNTILDGGATVIQLIMMINTEVPYSPPMGDIRFAGAEVGREAHFLSAGEHLSQS